MCAGKSFRVSLQMSCEVFLSIKRLVANLTVKKILLCVHILVIFQVVLSTKRLATHIAFKRGLLGVHQLVLIQFALVRETHATMNALQIFCPVMGHQHVCLILFFGGELLVTFITLVRVSKS